jgi:hypothetical protein
MHPADRIRAPAFEDRVRAGGAGLLGSPWLPCLLLLLGALLVRSIHLDVPAYTDEFYTMLAARGWLEDGAPTIGDGVYSRAQLYSLLVAQFLRTFGDNLVVGRLPSVIAGSLLVVAVFLWTRAVAGSLAAWIAALFIGLDPLQLLISQFTRFYALLGLVFWLGAIGVYTLVEKRPGGAKAAAIAVGAILCLALAVHLQELALMGLCGLAAWAAYALGVPWWQARRAEPRRLKLELAIGAGLLLAVAIAAIASGIAGDLLTRYRWAPVWNAGHRNEVWFYHVLLLQRYQTLWPIFPFLVMLAIARRPRPAIFCFVVFLVSFVLLSFGGMKDRRYISLFLPFLFVIWSIALAEAWPFLRRCIAITARGSLDRLAPGLATRPLRWVVVGLGVAFLVASNGAPARTLFQLAGANVVADGGGAEIRESRRIADWAGAREPLQPWWDSASVVLTSHDVQTFYFLGDFDIVVSSNRMSEIGGEQFELDPRTGRPVVSEPDAMRLILECYPDGLMVSTASGWPTGASIDPAVAAVIEAGASAIPLPAETGVLAFHWQHPAADPLASACAAIPGYEVGQIKR